MRACDPIWISLRGAKPPSRRTVDEAIDVRVPAVFRALAWLTFKLPRASRLRQAVIRRAVVQSYQDAFGDSTYEPQWIVDLGGDAFVMLLHHSLRGRASGASVEQVSAHRVELHEGLVVREEVFFAPGHDWASLAQAVGLDPAELARRQGT